MSNEQQKSRIDIYMMHGIQGSGKSYKARKIAAMYPRKCSTILSADDHFMKNGVYEFKSSRIGEFHGRCQIQFGAALMEMAVNYDERGPNQVIIVDNCNVIPNVIQAYHWFVRFVAKEYPHIPLTFKLEEPDTEWRYDVGECTKKCVHGTTSELVQRTLTQMMEARGGEVEVLLPDGVTKEKRNYPNRFEQFNRPLA